MGKEKTLFERNLCYIIGGTPINALIYTSLSNDLILCKKQMYWTLWGPTNMLLSLKKNHSIKTLHMVIYGSLGFRGCVYFRSILGKKCHVMLKSYQFWLAASTLPQQNCTMLCFCNFSSAEEGQKLWRLPFKAWIVRAVKDNWRPLAIFFK